MRHIRIKIILLKLILVISFMIQPIAIYAQETCSGAYCTNEYFFGTGGEVDISSDAYRARAATGALGVGDTSSSNYDARTGTITASEPFLEMVVSGATVSFGTLSDASASTGVAQAGACNCSFLVRSYLSSGYVVVTMSQPPTSEGGAVLDAKTTLGVPSTDTTVEEFGINLVNNSSPDIGEIPENVPDDTFADGEAATGYSTINQFKYNSGDTIARSQKTAGNQGIGRTDYTISYIAKAKSLTEAGFYTMNHELVVVTTF